MFLEVVNFPKIYEKIQQAKQLQLYISETEARMTTASQSLVALGIKTSNLKKLVQDIDSAVGRTLSQTLFKVVSGAISISTTEIDAAKDQQIRAILLPLLGRNITSSAVDKQRKNQISFISKEVAKYGMKASDFNNIMKKIPTITSQQEYVVYTSDGYFITFGAVENPPSDGGSGGSGGSGSGGSGGGSGGSGSGGEISLQWFEDEFVPAGGIPPVGIPGMFIRNIRSGLNVPIGSVSSYEVVANNQEGLSSDEVIAGTIAIRGQGTLKIYRNNVMQWTVEVGQEYSGQVIQYEYSVGEPGAWSWQQQSLNVPISFPGINPIIVTEQFISGLGGGEQYDPNTWSIKVGDNLSTFVVGLLRNSNSLRFEFTPTQTNSFARLMAVGYQGADLVATQEQPE